MRNNMMTNLKRITISTLALLMIAFNLMVVPTASAVEIPSLTIGSQTASNGDTISVPIDATNFANSVAGMDFSVQYDSSLLTYTGLTQNAISGHGMLLTNNIENTVIVNWFDLTALNIDNDTVLTLNFTVNSAITTNSNLSFTGITALSDSSGDPVIAYFVDGVITLNPVATLSSIAITSPATKLTYTVGDTLDITGLEVTGTYSDTSTKVETITVDNVSGFDSSAPAIGQVLTITVEGETTTYTIDILDTTPPTVLYSDPTDDSINVSINFEPTLVFSESIDATTMKAVNIQLREYDDNSAVPAILKLTKEDTVVIAPSSPLEYNKQYYFWIGTGLTDSNGVAFVKDTWYQNQKSQHEFITESIPLSSEKDITSFSFSEGAGTITETDITITVPYGTDVSTLTPTISLSGGTVSPLSGITQDFTNPVVYTVTAEDSTTQSYTVTITLAPNAAAHILSFGSTAPIANGVIDGTNITLTVPFGTSLVDLPIAIILSPGASISPVAGHTTFVDGIPVTYTVTAQDGVTTQNYSVTVNVAANTAKDVTSFDFNGLAPNVTGAIGETDITLNVPYGTDVTTLIPSIGISGASINPASGVPQDFTSPVTYTVTAADNSTQNYTVTVIIADPSDLSALTTAIATAQGKYDGAVEGILPGQYPAPLKTNLQTAINNASAITNSDTQSVVDAGVITLNNAVVTFEAGVVPPDTTAPVISLLGEAVVNLTVGDSYTDDGATALDNVDGDITGDIIIVNLVDVNTIGVYSVTYNVSDTAGNDAVQVTRTVNVKAVPATLSNIAITTPADKLIYATGDTLDISGLVITGTYDDATTNVETITTDDVSGFDSSVPVVGQVLTITVGDKTTSYTINVVDNIKPVITLLGSNPVNLYVGDSYADAGATALDNVDGDITSDIAVVNPVDTSVVGSYTIAYNVSDDAGNIAVEVTRIVNVTVKPVVRPPSGGSSYQAPVFNAPVGNFKVTINNGDAETNSTTVNLILNGGTAVNMAISNSSDFEGISLETYNATKTWVLSDGIGSKTVYVKFFNQNNIASSVVSATIKLVNKSTITTPVVVPTKTIVIPAPVTTGQVLGVKITLVDELIAKTKFGTRSEDNKLLQTELRKLGHFPTDIDSTGYYGSITKTAVEKYLASKVVIPAPVTTGQVLGVKITLVDELIAKTKLGTRSDDVKLLQTELRKLGHFPTDVYSTGYYGPITKTAVEKYLASIK